jgi:hypothetical protein
VAQTHIEQTKHVKNNHYQYSKYFIRQPSGTCAKLKGRKKPETAGAGGPALRKRLQFQGRPGQMARYQILMV